MRHIPKSLFLTPDRPRQKKHTHTHTIQNSYKKKRCCPPFTNAHKLTTVTNILLKEFLEAGMNMPMIVLRLIDTSLHWRTSPAAKGLLARFLRRGATPPQPQRPTPPIRWRGAARAPARPRRRYLPRVSPQSAGLSSLLSVLTQRLNTGMIVYRASFGGVLSDLRSRGSVDPPCRRRRREDLCGRP